MYLPAHFAAPDVAALHALMRAEPLATLVTLGDAGLDANHVPLLFDADPEGHGRLRGHLARANPMWREFRADTEVLAIFHGPAHYVSPSWYPTKQATGKVVPTWNFIVVHACGRMRVVDDADWLRAQVEELTRQQESGFAQPWQVGDAPADYIDKMLAAIVGIEIPLTSLVGKWKISQNQPAANRAGVADALAASADPGVREMAGMLRVHSPDGGR